LRVPFLSTLIAFGDTRVAPEQCLVQQQKSFDFCDTIMHCLHCTILCCGQGDEGINEYNYKNCSAFVNSTLMENYLFVLFLSVDLNTITLDSGTELAEWV
jgi:hypothetical protein